MVMPVSHKKLSWGIRVKVGCVFGFEGWLLLFFFVVAAALGSGSRWRLCRWEIQASVVCRSEERRSRMSAAWIPASSGFLISQD